jgi:hypothetical protein
MKIILVIILCLFHFTSLFSQDDLIKFNSKNIEFQLISKIQYEQVKKSQNFDFTADTASIQKVKGKFILQTGKGVESLTDTITNDETSNVKYNYVGQNECIKQYIIARHLYESVEYYFVDIETGKHTYIWNLPKISPDCRYICSLNLNWGMDPYPGGLLILKRDSIDQRLSSFFVIEFDNWISIDGYWINNFEFNFKIISPKYLDYSFDERVAKENEANIRYWNFKLKEN